MYLGVFKSHKQMKCLAMIKRREIKADPVAGELPRRPSDFELQETWCTFCD